MRGRHRTRADPAQWSVTQLLPAGFPDVLPPCHWDLPSRAPVDPSGLVAVGGDLEPPTLITAYARGLFPMPIDRRGRVGWFSPDPRGIIPLNGLRVSRSLRRSLRRYRVTVNEAFEQVVEACADPRRPHGWISRDIRDAYTRLFQAGIAESYEAWEGETLVGGLYGLRLGGLFAGESMFHRAQDASKVALVKLVDSLAATDGALLDVQWRTDHLATLGAIEISRDEYLERLDRALRVHSGRPDRPLD